MNHTTDWIFSKGRMTSDIGSWYHGIPQITRWWFTACVVVPLAARFGIVNGMWFILDWDLFFGKFQIWRAVTCAIYYPVTPQTGFHYLITLYFLYSYSSRLETGVFAGRQADYAYLVLFTWSIAVILALALQIMIIFEAMMFTVLYIWCQINREQIVSFYFGSQFKASHLPWVLLAFNFILRGSIMLELLGIFIGHLYFFLKFKYPIDFGGASFLDTPDFMYRLFRDTQSRVSGFGVAPTSRRRDDDNQGGGGGGGAHRWGRGQRLGGD